MLVSPFYDTAPEHASERAMASYALLDALHIPYQRIEHEKAETMEVCAAVSDALGVRICKNLFLCNRQQTSFYLLTMPEDKPFHTKDLSHQIGSSRLSFAPPEKWKSCWAARPGLQACWGCTTTAATPSVSSWTGTYIPRRISPATPVTTRRASNSKQRIC